MDAKLAKEWYLKQGFFSNIEGRELLRKLWLPALREIHFSRDEIEYTKEEADRFFTICKETLKHKEAKS
jgi:hypothetical protein